MNRKDRTTRVARAVGYLCMVALAVLVVVAAVAAGAPA
jgi:hypothetical protein